MSGEVLFQIGFRIAEGHPVFLQQRVDLEPRLEPEETPDLRLGQSACPITLNCDLFRDVKLHGLLDLRLYLTV